MTGMISLGIAHAQATYDLLAYEANFREFVHLILNSGENGGVREGALTSNMLEWHSVLRAKKDPATGLWTRDLDSSNKIRTGHIMIGEQPSN